MLYYLNKKKQGITEILRSSVLMPRESETHNITQVLATKQLKAIKITFH